MEKTTNILICGVGGQGVILVSELLGQAAVFAGMEVKQSEVHGVAQRGGAVVSHVRMGKKVYSPLIKTGESDFILAFEKLEAVRWAHHMRQGGKLIVDDNEIMPTVFDRKTKYPKDILKLLDKLNIHPIVAPATKEALRLGNIRTANVIICGVLASYLDIEDEVWTRTLEKRLPQKILDINLRAFKLGQEIAGKQPAETAAS
ncbi:MAG: indolepyruvate oxidoreductase subunit beta [Planctomycetota bacterium]|jgi:indolepyruvate ferredoxin oxidoreductase beta subunit